MLTIEDFVEWPQRFAGLVEGNLNIANRFAELLFMMNPHQMYLVTSVLLSLPCEVLAAVKARPGQLLDRLIHATVKFGTEAEVASLKSALADRLA